MALKFTVQRSYNQMSIEKFNLGLPCIKYERLGLLPRMPRVSARAYDIM